MVEKMLFRPVLLTLVYTPPQLETLWRYAVKDFISLNRGFLTLARQHAKDPAACLALGLSRETLQLLEELSMEQIDDLAATLPLSVFTMRLNSTQLKMVTEDERGIASRFIVSTLAARPEVGMVT